MTKHAEAKEMKRLTKVSNDNRPAGYHDVKTIDLTPTWAGVLPMLILALTNGTPEGQRIATEELRNMAKAADKWNEEVKR